LGDLPRLISLSSRSEKFVFYPVLSGSPNGSFLPTQLSSHATVHNSGGTYDNRSVAIGSILAKHRSSPVLCLGAASAFLFRSPVITNRFTSSDGTKRYLLCLHDGQLIESVLIPRDDRATFCISSQVGCALGCTFCLTGQLGLTRNLSVPEIVSQVELLARETTQRFSVVFMGMGEPFDNYDNVLHAIRILHDDHGLKVPMTRITVSTAGLIPGIERLAQEPLFPNLSISLTGVTNETRDALMPINRKYPVEAVMAEIRKL